MSKRLTVATVEQIKPAKTRREVPDGGCAGLYLVVHASGAKAWALRFRSPIERDGHGQRKAKKLTLGPLATVESDDKPELGKPLSLSQARVLAARALEQVARKIDPTHERRAEVAKARAELAEDDGTIDTALATFLARYKGRKKQGLRESTRQLTASYLGLRPDPDKSGEWIKTGNSVLKHWSGRPLTTITKRDVIDLVEAINDRGRGVTANRTLTILKTFFTWARKQDMRADSPAELVDAPAAEKSRNRTLSDAELAALWKAAETEGYPFGDMVRLLILTGARRDELREAPRSEFDINTALWKLPADRAKNGREHHVPLTGAALEILNGKQVPKHRARLKRTGLPRIKGKKLLFTLTGDTPVSGLSTAKKRIDKAMLTELRKTDPKAALEPWTLHDLRRTIASGLQRLGFSIEIVEAVLNHKSGTLRGVAGIYARHDYLPEKTRALESWARHVDQIVNGTQVNVINFSKPANVELR